MHTNGSISMWRRVIIGLAVTAAVGAAAPGTLAQTPDVPLIPRKVLFGNPDRAQFRISPDGQFVSYLAPVEGVMNVWVAPASDITQAKPVTNDRGRGINQHAWTHQPGVLTFLQDEGGDENWQCFSVNVVDGGVRNLTNNPAVATRFSGVSDRDPGHILLGFNDRNPQLHDLWRVNLLTGEKTLLIENPGIIEQHMVAGFVTDDDLRVRLAVGMNMQGGQTLFKLNEAGAWTPAFEIGAADALTTAPVGFDKSGKTLYLLDSRGRNTAALFSIDLASGQSTLVAEDARADIGGIVAHPTENTVQAVSFEYDRARYQIIDPAIQADFDYLRTVAPGDFTVTSRTSDDSKWTVAFTMDNGPLQFYLYDRAAKQAKLMFTSQPALEGLPLVNMKPVIIKSRDGLDLVSYLSLPPGTDPDGDGVPNQPVPAVLNVHGGPWARDSWGYNPEHQWLANRGYAVLSVNFRGSTGFGKEFVNAGDREWAGKMHDDLIDAVNWLVENNIAPRDRVAIYGGSYGGYATLVGLTFTPEVFAAGVSVVGPSNLRTLIESIPPYWAPMISLFHTRVGDNTTSEGREFLDSRSPLTRVQEIRKPLLIAQGANDPRVKQAESDQIVQAMNDHGIPVTYVLFPDEGHGFARPDNNRAYYAVAELFLSKHLGGRFEPIGDDFVGSSIQIPTDTAGLPGVVDAMGGPK